MDTGVVATEKVPVCETGCGLPMLNGQILTMAIVEEGLKCVFVLGHADCDKPYGNTPLATDLPHDHKFDCVVCEAVLREKAKWEAGR